MPPDTPCQRCGQPSYLTAYWGRTYCQPCTHAAAQAFDDPNHPATWPPTPEHTP